MNAALALSTYREEQRSVTWANERLERMPGVTRRGTSDGQINWVSAYQLTPENADAAIAAEILHFNKLGVEFEWKLFSFDEPTDLQAHLSKAGFEIGDREALVMFDLQDGLEGFEADRDVEVRHANTPAVIADYRQITESVFEKDFALTESHLLAALETGNPGHDAFVAYVNDEPVSGGRLYTDPNSAFGGLYGGGTLPAFRGKGIYRSVVRARAEFALNQGCRYVLVDAMPTSLPILLRQGFVHVADSWACTLNC